MNLHENIKLFNQAIQFTADLMKIRRVYVEKDYWVTFALRTIFHNKVGEDVIFKGGTALSKCYDLIDRFSEDIDLVVLRREGETDNQMKRKLKAISNSIEGDLPEIEVENITRKRGMNRKTAQTYNKEFKEAYGQVRDTIILEATWLGYYEPYTTREIISFVGKMMMESGQENLAKENGLLPFEVSVLEPTRTICEKIMSLVRFSHSNDPLGDLKNKVRHIYDLNRLLVQYDFEKFFLSPAFDEMLLKVAQDDVISFKNNNAWLKIPPKDALVFKDSEYVWQEMKEVYLNEFSHLVYGPLPEEHQMLLTLNKIAKRVENIKWEVKL